MPRSWKTLDRCSCSECEYFTGSFCCRVVRSLLSLGCTLLACRGCGGLFVLLLFGVELNLGGIWEARMLHPRVLV